MNAEQARAWVRDTPVSCSCEWEWDARRHWWVRTVLSYGCVWHAR